MLQRIAASFVTLVFLGGLFFYYYCAHLPSSIGAKTGIHVKSQRGRGGLVSNVLFRNITLVDPSTAVSLTLNYHTGLPQGNASSTPVFDNITLSQVTSSGATDGACRLSSPCCFKWRSAFGKPRSNTCHPVSLPSPTGWQLWGLPESPITGIYADDVSFTRTNKLVQNCEDATGACLAGTVSPQCPPCLA